jgi:hypothetical protein
MLHGRTPVAKRNGFASPSKTDRNTLLPSRWGCGMIRPGDGLGMADTSSWTTSAKIESSGGAVCLVLFWMWGAGGLILNTGNFLTATGAVGVGTSAYLTVGMLYWIGGMVLFGIGSLIHRSSYDFRRPNN